MTARHITDVHVSRIDNALQTMEAACGMDDAYWERLATGQDSEEAEDSGYMVGYREALAACLRILTHDDFQPLDNYIEEVREEMNRREKEVRGA